MKRRQRKPPAHEMKPVVRNGHGYSVQSSVLQSSGAPDEDLHQPSSGYDLQGIGGEKLKDLNQNTMGRVTRDAQPLMSHSGYEERGSDYDQPGIGGFRYRQRFDGV